MDELVDGQMDSSPLPDKAGGKGHVLTKLPCLVLKESSGDMLSIPCSVPVSLHPGQWEGVRPFLVEGER